MADKKSIDKNNSNDDNKEHDNQMPLDVHTKNNSVELAASCLKQQYKYSSNPPTSFASSTTSASPTTNPPTSLTTNPTKTALYTAIADTAATGNYITPDLPGRTMQSFYYQQH
jgi:hypothetical protein